LQTVQAKNLGVSGTVSASVSGEGTVDNPQLNAVVQLPQLQVRQNSISGIKAELKVAEHTANLNFDTQVSQASIHARGRVALSGDYDTDAVIDTNVIPIEALLATYSSSLPEGFAGQTELHATLKGPLKDKSRVEAHLSIPVLKASYQQLQIGIKKPIRMDYVNSVVTLQPSEISGTGTSLTFQGRMPIGGNAAPTLAAQGSIDARILKMVSPDVQSSGVVTLDVRASAIQEYCAYEVSRSGGSRATERNGRHHERSPADFEADGHGGRRAGVRGRVGHVQTEGAIQHRGEGELGAVALSRWLTDVAGNESCLERRHAAVHIEREGLDRQPVVHSGL